MYEERKRKFLNTFLGKGYSKIINIMEKFSDKLQSYLTKENEKQKWVLEIDLNDMYRLFFLIIFVVKVWWILFKITLHKIKVKNCMCDKIQAFLSYLKRFLGGIFILLLEDYPLCCYDSSKSIISPDD